MDAPAALSTARRLTSACSVWASIPSGIVPVSGSIPAIPEQKTKPPATIAWLYGPSAAGASSLDTARLLIGCLPGGGMNLGAAGFRAKRQRATNLEDRVAETLPRRV